jgi:hypothetical protein
MPADDLVINVRQIEGYTSANSALPDDALLIQRGGLGGPYLSIDAQILVGSALAQGGDMAIAGRLSAQAFQGGLAQFSNAAVSVLVAQKAAFSQATLGGCTIATLADVAGTVTSFNARTGDVCFALQDLLDAGGAPIFSPVFGGEPRAPTPASWSNSSRLATTGFVHRGIVEYIEHLLVDHPFVFTFNGRSGDVVLTEQDILGAGGGVVFDSIALTGIPTAPTAPPGTNTTQLATCAFVTAAVAAAIGGLAAVYAPLASPNFSGLPTGPTADPGTSTGQLATTSFVMTAVADSVAGVATFNTRSGNVVLNSADITAAGGAVLASPAFTGIPTAPTAAPGTANTQIATTAFVNAAIGVQSFNGRTGAVLLTAADLTAAGGALLASPTFTGLPSAPTAAPGTNTTQLATTQFVTAAVNASVLSFNGRTGAVSLIANDVSAAGGAVVASPAFTGVPTAPTAAPGTNTTQLATTQYVMSALSAGGGVSSFNGRAGAVTLTHADVAAVSVVPTATTFTVTGTGTYTPPAGVRYIRVRMVGGGGGGGGVIGGNAGGNGGNTSFAGWTALGGIGGQPGGTASVGGAGGAGGGPGANATGNLVLRLPGGVGGSGQSMAVIGSVGGNGGSTPFGGRATVRPTSVSDPPINTGAGGTGGFSTNATVGAAGGGGGGEYVEFYVATPTAGAISVGAGGALGSNGGSGVNGGAGDPGIIVIEEFYT